MAARARTATASTTTTTRSVRTLGTARARRMASAETAPREGRLVRLGADAPFRVAARPRTSGPIGGFVPASGAEPQAVTDRMAALAGNLGPAAHLLAPDDGHAV